MRALTLIQPWPWAIAYAGADVLNRPKPPPDDMKPDEIIAIHAGKGWDREAYAWLRSVALLLGIPPCPPRGQHVHGKIVALCRVGGPTAPRAASDPWFRPKLGACAWRLVNVARLPDPVECRGSTGLFEIPEGVKGGIYLSLERRRACFSCSRAREQRRGPNTCELSSDPSLFDAGGCAAWRPR